MVHRPSAAPCQVLGPLHRMPESETEVVLQLGRDTPNYYCRVIKNVEVNVKGECSVISIV